MTTTLLLIVDGKVCGTMSIPHTDLELFLAANASSMYVEDTTPGVNKIGMLYSGGGFSGEATPSVSYTSDFVKSPEQIKQEIVDATTQRLDLFAQTRGYDSMLSVCTYATSSIPQFAKEGQYCVNMRDATWNKLYQIMSEIMDGVRPMPASFDDIQEELPVLDWTDVI